MLEDEFDDDETLPELTQEEQDRFTREAILASREANDSEAGPVYETETPEFLAWLKEEVRLACKEADEHPERLLTSEQVLAFLDEDEIKGEPIQDAA